MNMKKIYCGIYTTGPSEMTDTYLMDAKQQKAEELLIPFYLWETLAHNFMLSKTGIIPDASAKKILRTLLRYINESENALLHIDPKIGDIHENFESKLAHDIGSDAGWFHTARSRNDQIATDQKLLVKQYIFTIFDALDGFCRVLGSKSIEYAHIPMPGFTHLRVAMPSSFGFWWQAYLEQAIDASELLHTTLEVIDKSPLGAGASYGVNWNIDPSQTQIALGFTKPLVNGLAAINNRGIHELYILGVFVAVMTSLSRMMEDIIFFSMPEIGLITFDEKFTSGSSIMPQKMNPDVAEKARSSAAIVLGCMTTTCLAMKGTPSGMNRDSAETKIVIIDACKTVIDTLHIISVLAKSVKPNKEKMVKMIKPALATKLADTLSKTCNLPFRQTHQAVGLALKTAGGDLEAVSEDLLFLCLAKTVGYSVPIVKKLIGKVLNEQNILVSYSYTGSPNPKFVVQQTKELQQSQKALMNKIEQKKLSFFKAKVKLIKDVENYVKQEEI